MKKRLSFGEVVQGYSIPVLNEREIRAGAGIMAIAVAVSLMQVIYLRDFVLVKYVVSLFLFDFIVRMLISPKYSPTLIIGRLIVWNQTPEYVGAKQKRFAWSIGLLLSSTMFVLMVILNTYSLIALIICYVCLGFLFFESAFGICLGCKIYPLIYKEKAQFCPGEICNLKSRHDIQKTSKIQMLVLVGCVLLALVLVYLLHDYFTIKPHFLFG